MSHYSRAPFRFRSLWSDATPRAPQSKTQWRESCSGWCAEEQHALFSIGPASNWPSCCLMATRNQALHRESAIRQEGLSPR